MIAIWANDRQRNY